MASRKKRKKTGKKKSGTNLSPEGKLGTKLLRYWKKGLYGEFVTLFQRHSERAKKTEAADLWDPAVYNLLLFALFEAKDFSLLDGFFQSLQIDPDLSETTLAALEVAKAGRDLCRGEASLEQLRSLPSQLPAPFYELREHLASIPDKAQSSALFDYLDGRRSKARKGEKHLALAGRLAKQLSEMSPASTRNRSVTPFTQLRNKLQEMRDLTQDRLTQQSRVLKDAAVLADLIRELAARPDNLQEEAQVRVFLRRSGFGFSRHPFVRSFWETALRLGCRTHGSKWEKSVRLGLRSHQEGILPGLPEHACTQLRARDRLAQQSREHFPGLFSDITLPLKEEVWSRRERIVLLFAVLARLRDVSRELFQRMAIPMDLDPQELGQIRKQATHLGCQAMLQLLPLLREMRPNQNDTLIKALGIWCSASGPLPMGGVKDQLTAIAREISGLDLPPHIWLFLLLKGGEIYSRAEKDPLLATIQSKASPMSLEEKSLTQAVFLLRETKHPVRVLERWSACLESSALQALARKFLLDCFEDSSNPEGDFFYIRLAPWLNIPRELMEKLLPLAGEDFPLRGLGELALAKRNPSTLLPENQEEASVFLKQLPPADILYRVLLWMLRFPPTRASDPFLAEIIGQVAEYADREDKWALLAEALNHYGSANLAYSVWQIWKKMGLLDAAHASEDFKQAKLWLKPLASRGKPSSTGGRKGKKSGKKKTLLDEVLEEKRKNKNKGSS